MGLVALLFWVLIAAICYFIYPDNKFIFYFLLFDFVAIWFLVFKKFKHKIFSLYPLLLLLGVYGLLHLPSVQTKLTKEAAAWFSEKVRTKVSVKSVDIGFFNKVMFEGILVEDLKKDTLLYAGTIKGNVNDWFFFKDSIKIENVGLDDVVIKLHRSDSVWNYQFITDLFASPKNKKKSGSKDPNIDLKELHFTNIKFSKIDEWIGDDMIVNLAKIDVTTNLVDIDHKKIYVKEILLNKPYFAQNDYDGKRPEDNRPKAPKPILLDKFQWNNDGWDIQLENLTLKEGAYKNDKQTDYPTYVNQFDGQHIFFNNINGSIKNAVFVNDTVKASIAILAKEKSGLEVKKLDALFKFTPTMMEFKGLDLVTNRSHLKDYYAMQYESFNKDFSRFLQNVTIDASFKESTLNSDDLAIFAPALKKWNRILKLEGNAKGTVVNFKATNLKIKTGDTYLEGNLSMNGLPDINSTFIDLNSKQFNTTYNEVASFVPEIKTITKPALSKLGAVSFKGNFTGFIKDFVANGTITSAMGNITTDVNMKIPEGKPAKYKGSIASNGFKLGQFIGVKELGDVALNVDIDGTGFGLKELKENVKGTVSNLYVNGYNYKNFVVDGHFENKLFEGHASINDPNLKISSLDGSINFMEKSPGFKLQANVQKADLKNLGLIKEKFQFSGDLDLDFTGNNIDNFLGNAKVRNATLLQADNKLSFDFLNVNSEIVNGQKSLTVNTNELEANVTGKFKILELPDAVTLLLTKYYPTYIKAPRRKVTSIQDFDFAIKTNNVESYVKLLDKKLTGFNNANINGHFNLQNYDLNLAATVPDFSYDGKTFNNIILQGIGNSDSLVADVAVDNISITDSFQFPKSNIRLAVSNDISVIKLNTTASKILGNAELNASVQTMSDGVKINFFPSSFIINDKKWQLDKNGELVLSKKFINASEVNFFHADQAIVLKTEIDESGETDETRLVADLKNIDIEDFAFLLPKSPSLKGKITGRAELNDIFSTRKISFAGAADSFYLDKKLIGKVNVQDAKFNMTDGKITYKGNIDEKDFVIDFDGEYSTKDSTGNSLKNNITTKRLDLSILKPYLSSVFTDVQGFANGRLKVNTRNNKLTLSGDAVIEDGKLNVGYTQVAYKILNQPITFGETSINLGDMQLQDTLGNKGMVSGIIYHNAFDDFEFSNLEFSSPKILVLNTKKKDNAQFYGRVVARAKMKLNGAISNMRMDIEGEPSSTDTSHVYLPTGESKESNVIDYIDFVQFGNVMKDVTAKSATNLKINLDITANENCKVDVILDEVTKDIISGKGNGRLLIKVGTNEPLAMSGQYELTEGDYKYNFQNFIKKPFELIKGGTITWNGDPFAAILDLNASYTAKKVDLSVLSNNAARTDGLRQQEDIVIVSKISGLLKQPSIRFEFGLPTSSELNSNDVIKKKLADYKNDDNETLKQVASLLLLNQFINNEQGFLTNGAINIANTTIGGILSTWLTGALNNAISKATNGKVSVDLDVNPNLSLQELQGNIRARLRYNITKNLQVNVGGNIDYNNPLTQLYSNGLITPELSLDWLINKDGSLRVVGFRRTSVDLSTGQRNRTGIQFSYRKDVSRFGDIFRSKKKVAYLDSVANEQPIVKRKK
jgi:hypothetical protein